MIWCLFALSLNARALTLYHGINLTQPAMDQTLATPWINTMPPREFVRLLRTVAARNGYWHVGPRALRLPLESCEVYLFGALIEHQVTNLARAYQKKKVSRIYLVGDAVVGESQGSALRAAERLLAEGVVASSAAHLITCGEKLPARPGR